MKSNSFTPDSRFHDMGREAVFTALFWVAYFLSVMASAYFLGAGDPVQYTYFFGFPLWFSVCVLITLGFMAVAVYMLKFRFKNVSLGAKDPSYDYEKDEVSQ